MVRIISKLALVGAMVMCLASPGFAADKVIKWKVQGFVPAGMLYHETLERMAKKPLKKIEDFKGIKMRMMPLMGDVLQKHGMSVLFVPAGEIMPNLQRGVLDAAEYSIPAFDKTLGIWEVCKYVMLPGLHQPASQLELLVNKQAYAALPEDLKVALQAAVADSRLDEWLWMESKNIEAIDFFKKNGVTIVTLDPETVQTMIKWAEDYLDERSAKDKTFAKVWNSQKEFTKKWYPYHKLFTLPH
jgi:TRAP-type mannitol/chloroaromatic compound transport system substrate-binding protein